jgi:glyoxylase-like metal-dependent hydrolase (beta-lactamase superfamily II)
MLFRQLFDRESCTYTYLLADGREAVLIDPVLEQVDRDAQILQELSLDLKFTLETHIHADHITGASMLRDRFGSQTVISEAGQVLCADRTVNHGDEIRFGGRHVSVLATPGHTSTCVSYLLDDKSMAFTGDALMVRGCGRTDFQGGDAATLYRSVHSQIFSLPARCQLYPGHDYQGRTMTTVAEELTHNPRLGGGRTLDQFIEIMDKLNLAQPAKIDIAVSANQKCGAPQG